MYIHFRTIVTLLLFTYVLNAVNIENTASLDYKINNTLFHIQSNLVSDPIISDTNTTNDFVLRCMENQPVPVNSGDTGKALRFFLHNIGNTTQSYDLYTEVNSSAPVDNAGIFIDNGNGVFGNGDIATSQIVLAPDENMTLFFVSDIPANASWRFSKNGIKAEDNTTASIVKIAYCSYENLTAPGGSDANLQLEKSALLSSPELYRGTIIHYRIKAKAVGSGLLKNIVVTDAVPEHTVYVPGSVRIDGIIQSDSSIFVGNLLSIPLPDMTQGDQHLITFDVEVIN